MAQGTFPLQPGTRPIDRAPYRTSPYKEVTRGLKCFSLRKGRMIGVVQMAHYYTAIVQ